MTQEDKRYLQDKLCHECDKELLLKDLCARLPYGIKFPMMCWDEEAGETIKPVTLYSINKDGYCSVSEDDYSPHIDEIKPYLFPMSSMTREQNDLWRDAWFPDLMTITDVNYPESEKYLAVSHAKSLDWLYKNHIDIYGFIEKGLAIDATGLNIY